MPFFLMYWKHLLAVALLATAGAWLYRAGGNAERVKCMAAQAKAQAAYVAELEAERKQASEQAAKLQRKLDRLPKAEGKTNEVVAANPAQCERPAAVADSLQAAVREANAAREVSGNP